MGYLFRRDMKAFGAKVAAFNPDCSEQHYVIQQRLWKRNKLFGASFSLILKYNMERSIFKKVRQFPDIFVKRSNTFLTEKALQSSIISPHHSDFLETLWYEKLILNAPALQYDYPHIFGLGRFIQISIKY